MGNARGIITVRVNDADYQLHLGMSVLADVQERHGNDALSQLDPPEGAPKGWLPPLRIVIDVMAGSLRRFHPDEARDQFFVDDLITQNPNAFDALMRANAAPPEAGKAARSAGKRSGQARRAG